MSKTFSRQQLYALVWSEPMCRLSTQIGVSDVALAKACRKAHIPVPERGYWARRQANKPTSKPILPPRGAGMPDRITLGPQDNQWSTMSNKGIPEVPAAPPLFSESIEEVRSNAARAVGKVSVPKASASYHSLIARFLRDDEERREKQRTSAYTSIFHRPIFDSVLERRRLRILSGLFTALQKMGHRPSIKGNVAREIGIQIGSQHVLLSLDRAVNNKRPQRHQIGSKETKAETLELSIGGGQRSEDDDVQTIWIDSDDLKLEQQLKHIVIEIIVYGEYQYRRVERHHYNWLVEQIARIEREEKERIEEEARKAEELRKALEKQKLDQLISEAEGMQTAAKIRAYVEAMVVAASSSHIHIDELRNWTNWAMEQANSIDPVAGLSLFGDLPNSLVAMK